MAYQQRHNKPAVPLARGPQPSPTPSDESGSLGEAEIHAKSKPQNGVKRGEKGKTKDTAAESPQATLLRKVRMLLEAGKAEEAFDLINARGMGDAVMKNARAVCLMRMGQPELAVRALREVCLTAHGSMLRSDIPPHFATNLAAALFAVGNVAGCVAILDELAQNDLLRVQELRGLVKQWEGQMTFWQRFKWKCGIQPSIPTNGQLTPADLDVPV